jgi:toxin ParE1/3/4
MMIFTVSFTRPAENDLAATIDYLKEILKAPIAAVNLLDEVEEKVKLLTENPFINPIDANDYLTENAIRHIRVKNYLMFYTINKEQRTVSIIRVLYARRDWENYLQGAE